MKVRVPFQKVAAVLLYLLAITGISLLGLKLSSAVAERAMILALPHVENGPPKRSLIEQRRLDAMFAVPRVPGGASRPATALEAPSRPADVLASSLDLAEREDFAPHVLFLVHPKQSGTVEGAGYTFKARRSLRWGRIQPKFRRPNRRGQLNPDGPSTQSKSSITTLIGGVGVSPCLACGSPQSTSGGQMLRLILVGALLGIRAQGRVDSGGVRLPAVRAGLCLDRCLPTLRVRESAP